jgi:hypothetical protein
MGGLCMPHSYRLQAAPQAQGFILDLISKGNAKRDKEERKTAVSE